MTAAARPAAGRAGAAHDWVTHGMPKRQASSGPAYSSSSWMTRSGVQREHASSRSPMARPTHTSVNIRRVRSAPGWSRSATSASSSSLKPMDVTGRPQRLTQSARLDPVATRTSWPASRAVRASGIIG